MTTRRVQSAGDVTAPRGAAAGLTLAMGGTTPPLGRTIPGGEAASVEEGGQGEGEGGGEEGWGPVVARICRLPLPGERIRDLRRRVPIPTRRGSSVARPGAWRVHGTSVCQ